MRQKITESGFEVMAKSGNDHMARVAKELPMFENIVVQARHQRAIAVA